MTNPQLEEVKNLVKEKTRKMKDPQHGFLHVQRIAILAEKIVKTLGLENKTDLNLLLAACFLHDINHTYFPPGFLNYFLEKRRLKKVLPRVLAELTINADEKKIIEKAIYAHPFSFPFKRLNPNGDLYTKVLQDADTLDFFSEEREISFKKAAKDFSFYSFLGLLSNWALKYGRNNLSRYLNFPQLAEEPYV